LVVLFLLAGCGSAQVRRSIKMDMWLGHHYSEVVDELGEPTEIKSDATGGMVLIYEFMSTKMEYNQKITKNEEDPSKTIEPVMICKFWVNEKGNIKNWWRGGSGEKDTDIASGFGYSNSRYNPRRTVSVGVHNRI